MVKRLIADKPDYYYGYAVLASYELELGNLKAAEANFLKAYELFPNKENLDELEAVRKAIERKAGLSPSGKK